MEGERSDAPTLGARQRREGFIGYPVICRPQGLGAKGRTGPSLAESVDQQPVRMGAG